MVSILVFLLSVISTILCITVLRHGYLYFSAYESGFRRGIKFSSSVCVHVANEMINAYIDRLTITELEELLERKKRQ